MHIEEFNFETHYEHLSNWLKARNMDSYHNLPACGYVVYDNDLLVAAAFLRRVEGDFGMFDNLCSNPDAPSESRNLAIDMLARQIIDKCGALDINGLLAWSSDKNTLERSIKHGFKVVPGVVITMNLGG